MTQVSVSVPILGGLPELRAVGHHGLQLLPVHPEPLLVLKLLVTLAVDVVTAALSGQAGPTIVDYVHIPEE